MTISEIDRYGWPEWLTPEYSDIHNAIYNCIVSALETCYASADAAGMDWTTEGHYSVAASNIIAWMRYQGYPPPDNIEPTQRRSVGEVLSHWAREYDEELVDCPLCGTPTPIEELPEQFRPE